MQTLFIVLPILVLCGVIVWAYLSYRRLKEERTRPVQKTKKKYNSYTGKYEEQPYTETETYIAINKSKLAQLVISLAIAVVSVFVLVFVPASFHQIDAGEVAVVKLWGEAKEVKTAGIHYDLWVSHKYEVYDCKVQQIVTTTETYSSDGQTMNIELVIQYKMQQDKALEIAKTYGGLSMLESRIETVSLEKMKSVLSQKSAMSIIETRATISPAIEENIRKAITADYYVDITTVVLTDISFTDAFEKTVEDKMIAEQEKLKAAYEKDKAIIQAEQALEVAKKEAEASIEKSKGEAEALKIMQDAWDALSGEVKDAMLKQMAIEKWDGHLPETMVGDEFIKELMGFISSKTE